MSHTVITFLTIPCLSWKNIGNIWGASCMLLGYYIPSEDSEVLGDLLGFLYASGCKMGGNGYCLASDSLFFCYIHPGEGINVDF